MPCLPLRTVIGGQTNFANHQMNPPVVPQRNPLLINDADTVFACVYVCVWARVSTNSLLLAKKYWLRKQTVKCLGCTKLLLG